MGVFDDAAVGQEKLLAQRMEDVSRIKFHASRFRLRLSIIRRLRRKDARVAHDELFENVVLDRAAQLRPGDSSLLPDRHVEGQHDDEEESRGAGAQAPPPNLKIYF